MVNGAHPDSVFLCPLAMLLGDPVVFPDKLLGGDSSETDNDFRSDQRHLISQVTDASFLLCLQRIPVMRRAALDDIGNVTVFSAQVHNGKHVIQKMPCRTHKGLPFQIFLLAGTFTDEHYIRIRRTNAKYNMISGLAQAAPCTVHAGVV